MQKNEAGAVICTKKQGKFPVSLDSILSVGYNRYVENCPSWGIYALEEVLTKTGYP